MNECVRRRSAYASCRPSSCTFRHIAWLKWNVQPFNSTSGSSVANACQRAASKSSNAAATAGGRVIICSRARSTCIGNADVVNVKSYPKFQQVLSSSWGCACDGGSWIPILIQSAIQLGGGTKHQRFYRLTDST